MFNFEVSHNEDGQLSVRLGDYHIIKAIFDDEIFIVVGYQRKLVQEASYAV